jgi:hypothetical protein
MYAIYGGCAFRLQSATSMPVEHYMSVIDILYDCHKAAIQVRCSGHMHLPRLIEKV